MKALDMNPELIRLNGFLNFKDDIQGKNRGFFDISNAEDYVTNKMAQGFNNMLFFPTMADKKNSPSISLSPKEMKAKTGRAITMIKTAIQLNNTKSGLDSEGNPIEISIPRRIDDDVLDIFVDYFIDEYNTINRYFENKEKVKNNPNLFVKNYFGTKKNNYADGNGGRFRYFNLLKIDGKVFHINEMLAKAEYAQDD